MYVQLKGFAYQQIYSPTIFCPDPMRQINYKPLVGFYLKTTYGAFSAQHYQNFLLHLQRQALRRFLHKNCLYHHHIYLPAMMESFLQNNQREFPSNG
ncbi:DUF2396 family protein [Aeromonas sp. R5-4]|uniref:DUF2396 family protein n=1 Tax=Aeromonas sp. R5-4 TaxID=3138470 RepID=UPI0034A1E19B